MGRLPGARKEAAIARLTTYKLTAIAAAAAILVLAALAFASAPSGSADPAIDSEESRFLTLINQYRQQNGLNTLTLQQDLNEAADWFANDMAAHDYFPTAQWCASNFDPPLPAHCDSTGGTLGDRLYAFGYGGGARASENAAAGFSSAQAVFDAWRNSAGHDANMRSTWAVVIGIGWACRTGTQYGCYWVTDFGSVNFPPGPNRPYGDSTPAPTPAPTASPSPTPTPTPVPTATPAPTPTPSPMGLQWDDLNCDGDLTAGDVVAMLMGDAGIDDGRGVSGPAGCPDIGDRVFAGGEMRRVGDIDCSGRVDGVDSLLLLRWIGGIPIDLVDLDCPAPGTGF